MPFTREEKYFASLLIWRKKSFKTVQEKFRRKFSFYNYPQKCQMYRWVEKFQVSKQPKKQNAENPRSGRKLTTRCPDSVNSVRDYVRGSPKKVLLKTSPRASLQRMLRKYLQLYSFRIQIKHTLTPADTDMPMVWEQDWSDSWFLWWCLIQRWSILLIMRIWAITVHTGAQKLQARCFRGALHSEKCTDHFGLETHTMRK